MSRPHRRRRLSVALVVSASLMLAALSASPVQASEEVVVSRPILKGALGDGGNVVRAPERRGDVVGLDGLQIDGGLDRIDVYQMDYKAGRLDKNDQQFWNKNARLDDPNTIFGANSKINGKQDYLTLGFRFGDSWKPGKNMTPSFHVLFDGKNAQPHTAGPNELIEGASIVHSAGQYVYDGGVYQLSTGARSQKGFTNGQFDRDASLLAVIDPKRKELRAVVPVPKGAENFSVLTEEYVDGVPQRDVVTHRGGQTWWSLTDPSFITDERCLTLTLFPDSHLDGSTTPALHGAIHDPTGNIPAEFPFGVGVIPEGGAAPTAVDGTWTVSPSGTHAWAEFNGAPGSLAYLPNGEVPEGVDPRTLFDPFYQDGWHSLAPVLVDDGFGTLIGDPRCGAIPWSGDCYANEDWAADFGIAGDVHMEPWRGPDGTWSCVHLSVDPPSPFLNTGQLPRGVDAAWLDRRGAKSYCHKTHVDIGAGGYLFQCPNGVASLVYYDHLSAENPLGLGFFVEYISPEAAEKPADYVAGDIPPGGLLTQEKVDALLGVGRLFMQERKADPELVAFVSPPGAETPE